MTDRARVHLFNTWAPDYDRAIASGQREFPFLGYRRVLDTVARHCGPGRGQTALDLGVGTGNLAARLMGRGFDVWGLDFSAQMLKRARTSLPGIKLVRADISRPWPHLRRKRFDRAVSAYTLHEFSLFVKLRILTRITRQHLVPGGSVVIGDISFSTVAQRARARQHWTNLWDETEHYWAADETIDVCGQHGLSATYTRVSACAGVYDIRGYPGST